jgi:MGT family glycosyltransferase
MKILWMNWSGGGNLPPSLGIARVLTERGHDVSFAGRPEMVVRVKRAGLRAIEITRAYEQAARYPNKWLPQAAAYLTSPAVAEEIGALLAREQPDLIIVDGMFLVALLEAALYGCPTVVMCHTSIVRLQRVWRDLITMLAGLRAEAGFGPLPTELNELWMVHDRLIVTTLKKLDQGPNDLAHAEKVRHVGPALERERHGVSVELPWHDDDAVPLVLVSYSTAPEQGSVAKFQAAIDALAQLPVHGVVTVGDSIDPGALKPAANVLVRATVDHDQLMQVAALVLTHGGHGTMMRALSNGLPMVVIPGIAADQPGNAAAVEAWGAGLALPPNADADKIASAAREILGQPSYREKARELARQFADVDGAANAADEIEALFADKSTETVGHG